MTIIKPIYYIVFFGFLVRLLFFLFGAELYFGKEDFYIQGDTLDYLFPFYNLIEHGSFSVNLNHPEGVLGREPGYSVFLGLFYYLSGKEVHLALRFAVIFQIFFDTFIILIIHKIVIILNFKNKIFTPIIYALYPFSLLWTSVGYAEILGVNFCILSVYFFAKNTIKGDFWCGIFSGLGILIRPQLIFLFPAYLLTKIIKFILDKKDKVLIKQITLYLVAISMSFGWWPVRNLILSSQFVLIKKVESVTRSISSDQLSFAFFMWAIKTDWEPQISQLLAGEEVEMPDWVWKISSEDSIKLKKALELSYKCGDGFRQLRKLPPLSEKEDCTEEVASLWKDLREQVIKTKPIEYYFKVPLSNLNKAIFKNGLEKSFNRADKSFEVNVLVYILFKYRSLMISLGIMGIVCILINSRFRIKDISAYVATFISTYFLALYFWLCFIYRDMDIRYLLPADVLLLIPASYLMGQLYYFVKKEIFFYLNSTRQNK
jgi:hypothetical protein